MAGQDAPRKAAVQAPPGTLLDHHCHGVLRTDPDPAAFEAFLTEADGPAAPGTSFFDTQLGFAVRRWCPPLLGLEPHCTPERYLARRRELGAREATRLLLRGSGIGAYVMDTGLPGDITGPAELAELSGAPVHEIVRLERLAELAADTTGDADAFLAELAAGIRAAATTAVGFKSVAAYRYGLDLAPEPPTLHEVREAAANWLKKRPKGDRPREKDDRLKDPVLLRHLLWSAVATRLPLQLHTGFGDPDLRLHRCDPLLLTDFIRATRRSGTPLILLHGYPYHRNAAYLAHVYPHVYADMGLTLSHTGTRAGAVLAEMLELTPFGKLLFSTDAYGLPELYVVGSRLFREGLDELLGAWTGSGAWSRTDAERVTELLASKNAERVYSAP
ncbi:amidohydrolase family protein [Streptomyces melanogenes]|uniref:amidohydrolase family protein n=1 Tax=Streptomyces melanogenes TaxID=67326 RepID=UPI00379C50CC